MVVENQRVRLAVLAGHCARDSGKSFAKFRSSERAVILTAGKAKAIRLLPGSQRSDARLTTLTRKSARRHPSPRQFARCAQWELGGAS